MGKHNQRREYWLILITVLPFFFPNLVHAQRSIGDVQKDFKETADKDRLDYPVTQWMGKKFIFLEKSKTLRKFGYDLHLTKDYLSRRTHNPELETEITKNLRYDKFVGRLIKVIDIEEDRTSNHIVTFLDEELNLRIYGRALRGFGFIDGIALFDSLAKAKERWLGKTVYSKRRRITTYNEDLDKFGEIEVRIGDPLKVIDIWWGNLFINPLWIIVETTTGKKGFIGTAFSWTNIHSQLWTKDRPWEDALFEFNPREKYGWGEEIWKLIDGRKVNLGMNKDQVKLSWGIPNKINEDISQGSIREQWVYDNQYLYFDNDILKSIQSH